MQNCVVCCVFHDNDKYYLSNIHGGRPILRSRLSIPSASLVSTSENPYTNRVDLINGFNVHRSSSGGLQIEESV